MKIIAPLLIAGFVSTAHAEVIELKFNVRLDRVYSYDGAPFTGLPIGATQDMTVTFNSDVLFSYSAANPWGPGTARLYSVLAGPVTVSSPYESFVPSNPFGTLWTTTYSAHGVTANERGSGPYSNIWYEDLWISKQYSQYETALSDGTNAYHYRFNLHWNKTNYDYAQGSLYYFTSDDIIALLDRSLAQGITFSVSQDAYTQSLNGAAIGFDLDGTAILSSYRVFSVPEPSSLMLLMAPLTLSLVTRKRRQAIKKKSLIAIVGRYENRHTVAWCGQRPNTCADVVKRHQELPPGDIKN